MTQGRREGITTDLVERIRGTELKLWTAHGIRLTVVSIAHDGRSLICSAFQARKAPLVRPLNTVALVQYAEEALHPLLGVGYRPMVQAIDWEHAEELRSSDRSLDPNDPIGLISALKNEGLPFPRPVEVDQKSTPVLGDSFWRKAISMFAI